MITSATTGTTVVSAASSIPLTGEGSVPRTTDGTAGNSNPAGKTWVDAAILINPPTATNNIGTNHTLTITVNSSGGNLDSGTATASKLYRGHHLVGGWDNNDLGNLEYCGRWGGPHPLHQRHYDA